MRQNTSYVILIFLIVSYVNSACDCDPSFKRSVSFGHNKDSLSASSITSVEYKDEPLSMGMVELQIPTNTYPILKYPEDAGKIAQVRRELQEKTPKLAPAPKDLKIILEIMWDKLYDLNLKFLSADQIGISEFIVVIDMDANRNRFLHPKIGNKKIVMISPEIIFSSSKEWMQVTETCVSVPGVQRDIQRPEVILVSFFNEKYTPHIMSADKELSCIIQHAVDHLYFNKCVTDTHGR